LSLCLIKHYAMKAYGEMDVWIHIFLTSALVGGEWSPSRPGRFTAREWSPSTHGIGCWVGPRASLDDMEKGNLSRPLKWIHNSFLLSLQRITNFT
jgi:hypothetical protein